MCGRANDWYTLVNNICDNHNSFIWMELLKLIFTDLCNPDANIVLETLNNYWKVNHQATILYVFCYFH